MKIIIFILSYNPKTFLLAKQKYLKYSWAYPILLKNATENNPYFENIFYLQLYENLEFNNIKIDTYDFIGTLSYKAYKKININEIDVYIKNFGTQQDFIHFYSPPNKTVLKSHKNGGNKFKNMWIDCCEEEIGNMDITDVGFCNYWMAKKEYFLQYCDFLKEFIKKLESHPNAFMDGNYIGGKLKPHQLKKLCGYPYYPILPFILERLVIGYFNKNNFIKMLQKKNIYCMKKFNVDEFPFYTYEKIKTVKFLKNNINVECFYKKLILYIFHKVDINVIYFLEHGLYNDENTDFVLIINQTYTKNSLQENVPNIKIKEIENYFINKFLNVFIFERENTGYDFGGWYDTLTKNNMWKKYNYFLFLNSSVLGPFSDNEKWGEPFLKIYILQKIILH